MIRSNKPTSITFFFPYYEVSGVPVLFLRMAEYLADRSGQCVYIVDYPDGYMSRTLHSNSGVSVIHFQDKIPVEIPPDTLLVMQSILPYTIRPELRIHPDTQVLFWTLHPLNLVQTVLPISFIKQFQLKYTLFYRIGLILLFPGLRGKLCRLVNDMHSKKSILFMDGSTLQTTLESLDIEIANPLMLPVPSDDAVDNIQIKNLQRPDKSLNFCWVGRLADFKIPILLYTLEQLKSYAELNRFSITVHIIGDGPEADKLNCFLEPCDFFKTIMVGSLSKAELDHYLVDSADILTAMGTSALEGARLGIPTILLDFSYGKIPKGYRFKWLYESTGFSLGEVINSKHIELGNTSLETMISDVLKNFDALSKKTFEYYISNHSMSSVADKFTFLAANANFRYRDFRSEIFEKGFVRKVYDYCRSKYFRW